MQYPHTNYMLRGSYVFLHVTNASMTNAEITSACSTVGLNVAHTGMSNHTILNLVTWKILLQHFLLFLFRLFNIFFASSSISLSAIIYIPSLLLWKPPWRQCNLLPIKTAHDWMQLTTVSRASQPWVAYMVCWNRAWAERSVILVRSWQIQLFAYQHYAWREQSRILKFPIKTAGKRQKSGINSAKNGKVGSCVHYHLFAFSATCLLAVRESIRPAKIEWWDVGMVISL